MLQAKQNVSDRALLTQQLRRYSADHVKITKEDTDQAKRLVDNYIKKEILPFICSESSLPISKQEYTGSLYEKLKTEAADEVDVMVILQTTKQEVTQEDAGVPGFVLLKASQDSQLQKYANAAGYILPEKLRASWFFGLVQKAVNQLQEKDPALPVKLEVRAHGPAVQLDITDKETEKKLSADLVPSFQLSATEYFVAKSYTGKISPACDPKLLWRQSFSLREKARLQDMDKEDQGCRHELLRIIKTLIRAESTFAKLTSYHLKTVFLHYNSNPKLMWGSDMLGERFLEYMEMLHRALAKKTLDHFWVEGVNLLDNIQDKTLENMADRLRKILDNDKERSKVLKCEMQLDSNGRKTKEKCPAMTSGNQEQILPNTCQTSTDLLQLLRKFLEQLGTILSDEIKWSKEVIEEYMKNGVLKYCQDNSPIISKFDYGGSLYENLKTTGPDEEDVLIHVILKAKKNFVTFNEDNPGCATIKAVEGSPHKEYSREDGLLMPQKFKSWLFKLVNSAVQELSSKEAASMSLKASSCSTGVKVLIIGQTKTLEVKLVPTFPLISSDEYFVPPSQQGSLPAGTDSDTAWVKSYTLMQKSLLKDMDKDQGCRHDLFKITNMVLRREPTFSPLSSFHVKTALLWYNQTTTEWKKEQLAERFTGFVGCLRDALQRKALKQFWITDLNLLEDISAVTLGIMESRLTKILNSEQERSKVLKAEKQEGKKQDGKNVASGTHTRSEMSPDMFPGEHPEKPSNQTRTSTARHLVWKTSGAEVTEANFKGYPGFPGGYMIAMQQDPLYRDFSAVAGADQQIDANKLQGYLSTSGFFGSYHLFSLETCRLMITMLNRDFSGKVGVDEFRELLILLRQWQDTFMECGHDESGTLGPRELQAALSSFGYGLSRKTFNNILERYSSNYRISFDDFVACCVRLKSVTVPLHTDDELDDLLDFKSRTKRFVERQGSMEDVLQMDKLSIVPEPAVKSARPKDNISMEPAELPMSTASRVTDIRAATMVFEARHGECIRVLPYIKDGQIVVQFYVYSGESGIPKDLKEEAETFFKDMNVKLEWSDLYNNSVNILKVQRLEYFGKPKTLTASQVEEMNDVIEKNLPIISKHRNVTSVQASFKIKNCTQKDEPCITIYVLGKGSIPFGESKFPTAFERYPVDVVNGFWIRAGKRPWKPKEAQEPSDVLCLGASIGVKGKEASGTLGAIVKDGSTYYALSCDHVMNSEESKCIVHPGLNDHLNYLKYYLAQYKRCVDDVTGLEIECSVETLSSSEALRDKFEELKDITKNHTESSRYTEKRIGKLEKAFEEGVEKPPREIGKYIFGVSDNVKWPNTNSKEYFIDAAITKLPDEEVTRLKQSRTARLIEGDIKISGGCRSPDMQTILEANELCKSGRTTGYTEIHNSIVGSVEPPHFMKRPLYELDGAFVSCLLKKFVCESCEESQHIVADSEEPRCCELCGQREVRSHERSWLRRCLCIREGVEEFAKSGDSGSVIFEKTAENVLEGFGLLFGIQSHQYHRYILASPLQIVLDALTEKLPGGSSLALVADYRE